MWFLDLISTIIQNMLIFFSVKSCLKPNKEEEKKIYFISCIIFLVAFLAFYRPYKWIELCLPFLSIILPCIFFWRNRYNAVMAYTLSMFIINIVGIFLIDIIFFTANCMLPSKYIDYEYSILIYIFSFIINLIIAKNVRYIKRIYDFLVEGRFLMLLIILQFLIGYMSLLRNEYNSYSRKITKIMMLIIFLMVIFMMIFLYINNRKSNKIFILFNQLNKTNSELREIKHRNELELYSLYNSCCFNDKEYVKSYFKNIIASKEMIFSKGDTSNKSILELVLDRAKDNNIEVFIKEEVDIDLIDIDELEFFRITSNIVNNAITAINNGNEKGIITIKSYKKNKNIFVKIRNNGPKIAEENLENIFEEGFTTKVKDNDNHGFGLNIVKELVEKNNGYIRVESNEEFTEFTIVLNLKIT